MNQERPQSVADAAKLSLLQPERKQRLAKEAVFVRSVDNTERQLLQAAKKVAAGESLYLAALSRPEKERG